MELCTPYVRLHGERGRYQMSLHLTKMGFHETVYGLTGAGATRAIHERGTYIARVTGDTIEVHTRHIPLREKAFRLNTTG